MAFFPVSFPEERSRPIPVRTSGNQESGFDAEGPMPPRG
jgi:hypothetical protein